MYTAEAKVGGARAYHGFVDLARVDPPLLPVPVERPAAHDVEAVDVLERDPPLRAIAVEPDRPVRRRLQRSPDLITRDINITNRACRRRTVCVLL